MLTNEGKRKLMAGAMFGLPMGLVLITARMIGGPESAEASQAPALATVTLDLDDVPGIDPTVEQVAAADHIATLTEAEFGPTPFHHHSGDDVPLIIEDPEDTPVPKFIVKTIMQSSAGNRAIIGRKMYKVGDELEETGWIIVAINADSRSVDIRDPETDRIRTGGVK